MSIRETKDGYEIICNVCGTEAFTTVLNRHSFEAMAFCKGWELLGYSGENHICPECSGNPGMGDEE